MTVLVGNAVYGRVTYWLMEWQLIGHVVLAGLGTYVLLRRLGTTVAAALAGATVYEVGAFFASQTQHLGAVSGAGWLPWLLAALYRVEKRRDWSAAALAAVVLALMILPGFPPTYLPALVFGPLLYLQWMWQRNPRWQWRPHARALGLLCAVVALALLLTAVSWLPGYQVGKHSLATLRPPSQALDGLAPEAATSFFWPNLFNQLRGDYWLKENTTFLHLYQGAPVLLVLLAGLAWFARAPQARPWLAAAGVALLWMFGQTFFLAQFFYLLFPHFVARGLYPQFVLAYFSLFCAALLALALDAYQRGERPALLRPRLCWRLAAAAGVIALLVSAAGAFSPPESPFGVRAAASGASLMLVALSLGLCGLLLRGHADAGPPARRRLAYGFCGLVLFDLLAIGSHTHITTYPGAGDPEPPAVSFLRQRLGPLPSYRIDTSDLGYNWQAKVAQWRLPSANGMNPLMLKDTLIYRLPYSRSDDRQFSLELPDSPLLDLAGVRYIVASREKVPGAHLIYHGEVNVFENPRALPRYSLVGGLAIAKDIGDAVRMIHTREVDPARVAVVSARDAATFSGLAGPAGSEELGEVRLLGYAPNELRLRVTAARPAVLVVTETFWRDWRATLDGAPHPLVRADALFRAVFVPAGTHEVRMFIVPRMLYAGAAVSCLGLLLCGFCLVWPAARPTTAVSPAATRQS